MTPLEMSGKEIVEKQPRKFWILNTLRCCVHVMEQAAEWKCLKAGGGKRRMILVRIIEYTFLDLRNKA